MRGLTKVEKEKIEKLAEEVLRKNNMEEPNFVDVLKLAQQLGFTVGNARLDDSEDGFIVSNSKKEDIKIIGVNSNRDFYLKRFIIAHELGHYILSETNNEKDKIFAHRENKVGKNEEENSVDYFAACLLMPKLSYENAYNKLKAEKNTEYEIFKKLSDIFKVPFESTVRRRDELELGEICPNPRYFNAEIQGSRKIY